MLKNILLFITTLVFSLLLGVTLVEGFSIYKSNYHTEWHDPNTKFDKHLGWSPIKNRSIIVPEWGKVSSNSLGFRSNEIDFTKEQVVILGDSVAWGYGVGDKETISYFLENELIEDNIQVSNLGVSGYGLGQAYLYLKQNIDRFRNLKSVILVICSGTDYEDTQYDNAYEKRKPYFYLKNGQVTLDQKSIFKYDLMNLYSMSSLLPRMAQVHPKIKSFLLDLRGEKVSSDEDMPYIIAGLLSKIDALAKQYEADFKVVLTPEVREIHGHQEYYPWFQKITKAQGYDVLDFKEILESIPNSESLYLDNFHYTKRGNSFLAKSIKQRWFA